VRGKGHFAAVELEGDVANLSLGGRAARRGRNDHRSLQGKPAALRFSPTGTGRGGESGAAGGVRLRKGHH
jgi:hypothetical protein